ncbi:hypothetical protein GOP56_11200 [Brevibacillus sp. 7WMA2]|uniref:hypothetical protein n=1 Tax=Brevibacillus TaxID=55080 RepID=UPI000C782695|nr:MULTISPECIES: hypothetical protein [Brevibacillus]AUM66398.1 hypothetical protein C0R09_18770 [Brevibacillus laterosporus]AYK07753.1 hypothetical protein D8Z77_16020 [Brevibacillus laterosporus]QIC06126.1 hypothetical protein GOP56_11200 [Brevibacillus sp. 7WMA2]WPS88818.1 hypothetical protein SMD22_07655 [Brevibacillus halotolerans]
MKNKFSKILSVVALSTLVFSPSVLAADKVWKTVTYEKVLRHWSGKFDPEINYDNGKGYSGKLKLVSTSCDVRDAEIEECDITYEGWLYYQY